MRIVKSFSYRGAPKLWSNRYYITGTAPSGPSVWTTLIDAIVTAEKNALHTTTTIVEGVGILGGSDLPVFQKTYSTAGLLSLSTGVLVPGDCAALVRYATASRTTKNHPLYLFNYYHGVSASGASTPDTLSTQSATGLGNYATTWVSGISDGSITRKRCGPNGDVATGQLVATVVKHRDFPGGQESRHGAPGGFARPDQRTAGRPSFSPIATSAT